MAFIRAATGGRPSRYFVNADGSRQRASGIRTFEMRWAPNGRRNAFATLGPNSILSRPQDRTEAGGTSAAAFGSPLGPRGQSPGQHGGPDGVVGARLCDLRIDGAVDVILHLLLARSLDRVERLIGGLNRRFRFRFWFTWRTGRCGIGCVSHRRFCVAGRSVLDRRWPRRTPVGSGS